VATFSLTMQRSGLFANAGMEIARERAEAGRKIEELLERGDDQKALELMRKHLVVVMPRT